MKLQDSLEYNFVQAEVKNLCGIVLDESKMYLVETRLSSLLDNFKCQNFYNLFKLAKTDTNVKEMIIDAISTHETYFFRHPQITAAILESIMPDILKKSPGRTSQIRIWSAACSTGQEAYSVGMALDQKYGYALKWNILGTDISQYAVTRASDGVYSETEMARGLQIEYKNKYFINLSEKWKIASDIKINCNFRKLNLLEENPYLGAFDIILCCNVSIYFSNESRKILFKNLIQHMNPGGYLILAPTDTVETTIAGLKNINIYDFPVWQKPSETY